MAYAAGHRSSPGSIAFGTRKVCHTLLDQFQDQSARTLAIFHNLWQSGRRASRPSQAKELRFSDASALAKYATSNAFGRIIQHIYIMHSLFRLSCATPSTVPVVRGRRAEFTQRARQRLQRNVACQTDAFECVLAQARREMNSLASFSALCRVEYNVM